MEQYAIGSQDFKVLIDGGYVYVDKTHFIPKLLQNGKYKFLARPRRFGKSLLVSTLKYFFQGEKELFKGLNIEAFDWVWEEYPVIMIDLNGGNYSQEGFLLQKLNHILDKCEKKYGLEISKGEPEIRLENLIHDLYVKKGKPVVILVDEYEKPVIDNLDNVHLLETNRDILRGFYAVLKSADPFLNFIFLTGVTKFRQMNVFSGLNNIRDISMVPEFGAICGVTEEELIKNFKEGIEGIAFDKEISITEAINLLKQNYDGYHFCRNCPDIYNPYSLINAFADSRIGPYWAYTGTPKLLAHLLRQKNYNLKSLENVEADQERLMGVNNHFEDPVALFYQTGYLTIKSYDSHTELYSLGYPNREVEHAFFKYLLPNYSGLNVMTAESFMEQLNSALKIGDPQKAMEILQEFSAGISYDVIPRAESERHFQYLLYIIVKLLSSRKDFVKVEEKTSDGRIDLLILTDKFVYVIEIKRDSSADEALKQIKEKEYYLQYGNDPRKVFLIGVNFSTDKKRIDSFIIEN